MLRKNALEVIYLPIAEVKPSARNARKHTVKQIAQIASSIVEFGPTNPILVDEDKTIIAGHGRLQAFKQLQNPVVPTITISGLTEKQKLGLMIADNKIALNSSWDDDLLSEALRELSAPEIDLDFDALGFDTAEIDNLIIVSDERAAKTDPMDRVNAIDRSRPAITELGDVWKMGQHLLLCGNALLPADYGSLLSAEKADMIFTDPPYNVKIDGHVGGLGGTRHDEFAMASGEMSSAEFAQFLSEFLGQAASYCVDGAMVFCCMDWRHIGEMMAAITTTGLGYKNLVIWDKINGGMGSLYRSQHELVFVLKVGTSPHTNNVELGRHGRYRTNVWRHPGANMFRRGRQKDLSEHPTVKPVGLVADAIRDCSNRNELILDPFGGSGTTVLAAERTGRRARLLELDPWYCDVAVRRWQSMTGEQARHRRSGATFAQLQASRETETPPTQTQGDCDE